MQSYKKTCDDAQFSVHFNDYSECIDVFVEFFVERMACHGGGIAEDDEFHAGAGDGHVHATEVSEETDLSFVVGTDEGDEDDVAFLALEAIDGVDADEVAVRFEELAFLEEATEVLHLGAVGGNDAYVEAFIEDAGFADLLKILFEGEEGEFGLGLVDAAEGFADELLFEKGLGRMLWIVWIIRKIKLGGVDPGHGDVEVEDGAVFHFGSRFDLVAVEPVGGETHDLFVHAVLHLEEGDCFGMVFYDAFHERLAETRFQGCETLDGGWELAMVAGEDDARHPSDGNPAGCFECLSRLVNEERTEFLTFEQAVGRAHEGTGDDAGLAEELGVDADLQFGGAFFEAFEFLVIAVAATLAMTPEVPDGFPDRPEEGVVWVSLEASLIGEGEHLIVDAGGIADAEDVDAAVDEFLGDPVDGHVALGADKDLVLAAESLVDGLDEGGGLAGAGRAVDDGDIFRTEDLVDGVFLGAV